MDTTIQKIINWLNSPIGKWIGALLILIIGYFVAKLVAAAVRKAISRSNLDEKLGNVLEQDTDGFEKGISTFFFYLVMLFVVVLALNVAGQMVVLEPLRKLLSDIINFLPGLIAAGVIGFAAWILATFGKNLLVGLLTASKVDERLGLSDSKPITNSVGLVAFFGIILLMLPSALSQLGMEQISGPVSEMLKQIFSYMPKLLAGIVLFAIGYLIATTVQKVLSSVLSSIGTDSLPAKLGYTGGVFGGRKLSQVLGYVAMSTILVIMTAQALQAMDLGFISKLAEGFVPGYFNILLALIIFAAAFFLANIIGQLIEGKSPFWAQVVRIGIIVFLGAVALQKADISNLTNETFQLIVNAMIIAAAFAAGVGGAIAIGLGGREKASHWLSKMK
jgi:Conserved TM helix